jgi:hypothetical protein
MFDRIRPRHRSHNGALNMTERAPVIDDTAMKFGLLMESAQAHQKVAETQLQTLRAHTQDLDGVVRDEIRRTLVEELRMLTAETASATRALQQLRRGAMRRGTAWGLAAAALCALIPIAVARWVLPTAAEVAALKARRDDMALNLKQLEALGARVDWRRCGEERRLCVRVDRKAPTYGGQADYYVLAGY